MKSELKWKLVLILSMVIFGLLGLTNHQVQDSLSTGFLCMLRGLCGAVFVFLFRVITGHMPDWKAIGKNLLLLALSGILLGLNWAMLFMSYRYLDTSVGCLLYYMAPMIVIFVSPFIFKEKLSWKKLICVLVAIVGLVMISGVLSGGLGTDGTKMQPTWVGFIYGFAAAGCYALMYILNKKMVGVSGFDRSIVQLFFGGLVMIPYIFIAEGGFRPVSWTPSLIFWTAVIAIVQTGLVYSMYYGCIEHVPA